METPLKINVSEGIATLTLNRPEALNSLDAALRAALVEALGNMDARDDVRVIILTGQGRAFTAGLDIKQLGASDASVAESVETTDIGAALTALKTPIIAAINGLAVTGGFEITLSCDIVIAAESAWFRDSHAEIGLLPGWGLSQRLARAIGLARAKEISLTARRVPATEAAALGFVTRVVPDGDLMAEARATAAAIAKLDGRVTREIKSLIDAGFTLPLDQALAYEADRSRKFNAEVSLGRNKEETR